MAKKARALVDYESELNAVVKNLKMVASVADVRGEGASSFVFAEANARAIELSSSVDGVWVEYWQGDIETPDHECLFHTYEAATLDARQWLIRKTVLDQSLPCANCESPFTLRNLLDRATGSWPNQKWIAVVCPCCRQTIHVQLHHTTLSVGELDGFPGPTFVPKLNVDISTISFATQNDGINLYYKSLTWFVPSVSREKST